MMRRIALGLAVAVALLTTVALLLPGSASAHTSQVASTPAAGAVLDQPPAKVSIEFESPLLDIGAAIVVRTSDGTVVSSGEPLIDRRSISVALVPDAPDGEYTVAYRVVSQDGHAIESTFTFRVGQAAVAPQASTLAAPSAQASAAADSVIAPDEGGHSLLVWLVAGLLLVVIIVVGTILLRR